MVLVLFFYLFPFLGGIFSLKKFNDSEFCSVVVVVVGWILEAWMLWEEDQGEHKGVVSTSFWGMVNACKWLSTR